MNHQILIPHTETDITRYHIIIDCLEALYETKFHYMFLSNKMFAVINTTHNLGKKPALRILKKFGYEYIIFIKEDEVFKKYLDTGIVDKLGDKNNVQFT